MAAVARSTGFLLRSRGGHGRMPSSRILSSLPLASATRLGGPTLQRASFVKQQRFVAFSSASAERIQSWEERSLNHWAVNRLKELILSVEPITFEEGRATITDVSRCTGDAAVLTVRGKKCVDFGFDITVDFQGKIEVGELSEDVEGTLQLDACYGELDDLQSHLKFTLWPENVHESERGWMRDHMITFVPKIQEKLLCFEKEFKEMSL